LDLLAALWRDTEKGIYLAAKSTYDKYLSDLRSQNQEQFTSFWRSRVVSITQLHTTGLHVLDDSTLKDQLSELLQTHVTQDLITANIKRAKAKGLVRAAQTQKNITKLEEAISAERKERTSPLDALAKFNKKMSIEPATSEEMPVVKTEYLQGIAQAMRKDGDGPRLFLGVVVNLFASRHDGVVYATGKFAPRLLKLLKGDLDAGLFKRLEEVKEAVKAGTINDVMRTDMRGMVEVATL